MSVEIFDFLPAQAKQIRITVFMDEQGFVEEFDALDDVCAHLVMFDRDIPVATCRTWLAKDGWHVGRLAVIKAYRGSGLGQEMLEHAEKYVRELGGNSISLHAQLRAEAFYRKCGYVSYGEIDYDEGVEHVHMKKLLI